MKYALVFLFVVLATASVFSMTREECYAEAGTKAAQLHAQNKAQNPAGSITVSTYGCSGTCAYTYQQCEKNAEDGPYATCVANANIGGMTAAKGDACIQQLYSLYLQCGEQEIDCCKGAAEAECDATYWPADTPSTDRPEDAQGRNECAEELGPYGEYNPTGGKCYCPTEYTFYNEYTRQCVLSTVYAFCEERNAAYDKETDSCICYEGYEPYGNSCVEAGSGAGGGSLGGGAGGAAGGYSSGGGSSGAGTCFIVAPFALLALAVLAGKRV